MALGVSGSPSVSGWFRDSIGTMCGPLSSPANAVGTTNMNNIITATTNIELVIRFRWHDVCCLVELEGISTKELQESLPQQLAAAVCLFLETLSETIPKCISASNRGCEDLKKQSLSLVISGLGTQTSAKLENSNQPSSDFIIYRSESNRSTSTCQPIFWSNLSITLWFCSRELIRMHSVQISSPDSESPGDQILS